VSVQMQDVVVISGSRTLVDVGELRLERGRAVTVVGESGSGKSLLAHALMGTLPGELRSSGRLRLDGAEHDLADRSARRPLWGRVLSLLPQEPTLALDPTMRIGAQVAEGAPVFRADPRTARRCASELLGSLGLGGETRSFPHTLSGGMAQRVAFAAATIGGASVLLADEPSKGLDPAARDELAALLVRHLERGGVLLTITHDLDLARALAGEVLVMKDAEIVERGDARQVLSAPAHPYTRRLLAAEPSGWAHPWMRPARAPGAADARAVLVQATGLAKAFGAKQLFADVDVSLRSGDRVALSGPSGAGKSTLGNVLLRLASPDAGQVRHGAALAGGRVQKLYQDPALAFPARVPLRAGLDDVARRHRLEPGRREELLASLGLPTSLLDRRPGQVSGGELQRLAVLRAMLLEPALVLADEPTSRLDLISQEQTVRCLMEQVDRRDCALLLVTHDEALADAVADSRVWLSSGRTSAAVAPA
jgi:peptide/nickel transport system ATP-binding protein